VGENSKSTKGQQITNTAIIDSCINCIDFFDKNGLNELKIELPIGLAKFNSKENKIIKVDYIDHNDNNTYLIEPMYFGMYSYRSIGKSIYIEQTLSKPCVQSMKDVINYYDDLIYDIEPDSFVTIRKIVANPNYIEQFITKLLKAANEFYHLYCYPVELSEIANLHTK
jgi:hypothetical protein